MERQEMNHEVQNGLVPWYGYGLWPDEKFADDSPATDNPIPNPEDDDSGDDWEDDEESLDSDYEYDLLIDLKVNLYAED